MADDEERIKAEKLAAARKRVAQIQKQKKKASKKSVDDTKKDVESPSRTETPDTAATPEDQPGGKSDGVVHEGQSDREMPGGESLVEDVSYDPTAFDAHNQAESAGPDISTSVSHDRQQSLSIQSKMRSSSFRKNSVSQGSASYPSTSATLKSPTLPSLTGDGSEIHELYKKQSSKIEELERSRSLLEKGLKEATEQWKRTEDELENLREASVDIAELKEQLQRAEEESKEIDTLRAEIASLQRQNSHLQMKSHRSNTSVSASAPPESLPSDLVSQLESKSDTIEAMELEISNLRAQISRQFTASATHKRQIAALEEKLSMSESSIEQSQNELADAKRALNRASEKAVKEGVEKTSTETLIKSLEREIEDLKNEKTESDKKTNMLEKKLQALSNLHKESESRYQVRIREVENIEKEASALRRKLASVENENLRLKETQDRRLREHEASGGTDDDAIDELEDEERSRLRRRIRDLEGEVFDLRRGFWKEKRLGSGSEAEKHSHAGTSSFSAANAFDDVDLTGGAPEHARRRSINQQQHSSLSAVLSGGFAALTGTDRTHSQPSQQYAPPARGSLELLSEEDEFDEDAFAREQAEEEARKRVEWVREIKSKLKDWQGWRLDLVDSRAGAEGAGVGMGEIFEV